MAAFGVPVFNLPVRIWIGENHPPTGAPRVETMCNLATGRIARVPAWIPYKASGTQRPLALQSCILVPAGTDIRDESCITGHDTVEVPTGTGRFYWVTFVEDVARGFPNEHRMAIIQKMFFYDNLSTYKWPVPIP